MAELFDGAFYLTKVDALHRRSYARKPDPLARQSSGKKM